MIHVRLLAACLLSMSFLSLYSQPTEPNLKWGKPSEEELTMTEYAPDKDAEAVVLCNLTDVDYEYMNGGFKVFYRMKTRLKILKAEGKRYADVTIAYNSPEGEIAKDVVVAIKGTAYNIVIGKTVRTKMDKSMIHDERIDKRQKQVKFSVPQVQVGSVVEYEYRIESDSYYDIYDWYAQRTIPVAYTRYFLSIPEWFVFGIEETGINKMERKQEQASRTIPLANGVENINTKEYTFVGRDLPALRDDDFVWHAADYSNKVTAELQRITIPGFLYKSYTTKWEDIDNQLMGDNDFGGRLKSSSPLKDEIKAAGIPQIANTVERAAATWKLLRQKLRWNGAYALGGHAASKVMKEGTGTNADLNFIYMNMLNDAGIQSTPIVLRTRNRGLLPMSHPSLKYLNTFIVGIHDTDSTMIFMDASAEDGYLNVLPAPLLVSQARAIPREGQGYWVDLQQAASSKITTVISATLSADGLLSGQRVVTAVGEAAATLRKSWREAKDSAEVIRSREEKNDIEIQQYDIAGHNEFSSTVKETLSFTKQCDAAGDIIYVNPLVFPPMKQSPFSDAERQLPVEMPCKHAETISIVMTLPDGYGIEELPKPLIITLDGSSCKILASVQGQQLIMQYRFSLDKTFFPQSEYGNLKQYFDRIAEAVNQMLTIKKLAQ